MSDDTPPVNDTGKPQGPSRPREHQRSPREPRLRDIARRLFRESDGDPQGSPPPPDAPKKERPPHRENSRLDPRDVLSSVLETGDKARMELVRLLAREFRGYLEAMEIHKDLNHLITNYSLEVNASIHLKPIPRDGDANPAPEPGPDVSVGLKPKTPADDES